MKSFLLHLIVALLISLFGMAFGLSEFQHNGSGGLLILAAGVIASGFYIGRVEGPRKWQVAMAYTPVIFLWMCTTMSPVAWRGGKALIDLFVTNLIIFGVLTVGLLAARFSRRLEDSIGPMGRTNGAPF